MSLARELELAEPSWRWIGYGPDYAIGHRDGRLVRVGLVVEPRRCARCDAETALRLCSACYGDEAREARR